MRVLLVGTAASRAKLHARLAGTGIEITGEFATLLDAKASESDADGILVARGGDDLRTAPRRIDVAVEPLTSREVEVLELLAEGLPNKAIADRLGISDQTVKFHVASISAKLGAANRTDAVRRAVRRGLITL